MFLMTLGFIDKAKSLAASLQMDLFAHPQMVVLVIPNMALCPRKGTPLQRTLVKSKGFVFY